MASQEQQKAIDFLRTLPAVRARTTALLDSPSDLANFDVDPSKLPAVVDAIIDLIHRDYPTPSAIPPHSRWRHFEVAVPGRKPVQRVHALLKVWEAAGVDKIECVRRLLDLFVVSVLLDAGAGATWKFVVPATGNPLNLSSQEADDGAIYNRSEGLAIASLFWFMDGGLSSDSKVPHQVDAESLTKVTADALCASFQVTDQNPLVGVEGRVQLLQSLGKVLAAHPKFFGGSDPSAGSRRPGNMVDFLLSHPTTITRQDKTTSVQVSALWEVVMDGLSGIWPPTRTRIAGVPMGDVWPSKALAKISKDSTTTGFDLVPFHKLSQWLTYSLMEPLSLLGITFEGMEVMTGLAEYRNGGLFVDYGVITLKKPILASFGGSVPRFNVYDDAVVEWRALTVALLDKVGKSVREKLGMSENDLPLVKVLEAGTWKLGREIAAKLRPDTKGPPIEIISDGTVF
ncbi:hypothetical protein HDU67_008649 [Dinochytrium kinnereticum]|nr:hypothetical protein HDU67_008649 [Dinochytrium kinnereticum]